MSEGGISQSALKVCGALAMFGAAGALGAVGATAFAATLGTAVAVPFFTHFAKGGIDAGIDLLKAVGEAKVDEAIKARHEGSRSRTNHHVVRAVVESLKEAVKSVHANARAFGLDSNAEDALLAAAVRLKKMDQDTDLLDRFSLSVEQHIFDESNDDPTAAGRALVQACLVYDRALELSRYLDVPILIVLQLRGRIQDAEAAQRIVGFVRDDFAKNLGPRVAKILSQHEDTRTKFDLIAKDIQLRAMDTHTEILQSVLSELRLQKVYLAQHARDQEQFNQILEGLGAIRQGQSVIIGTLARVEEDIDKIKHRVNAIYGQNEEILSMMRLFFDVLRAQERVA